MEIFALLAIIYAVTFFLGKQIEKIKIPWLFMALFLGMFFSITSVDLTQVTSSPDFQFLSNLGMIFLLFLIGFEFDWKKFKKLRKAIIATTFIIILLDILAGTFLISSFGYTLIVAFITALSIATIGEAVLVPILDEFKLFKSKLGTTIIGIGVFDDLFEIVAILLASILIAGQSYEFLANASLALLAILAFSVILIKFKNIERRLVKVPKIEEAFLFSLFVLFVFMSFGSLASAEILSAFVAGIVLKNLLSKKTSEVIEEGIKFVGYGLLAPIFFFDVGYSVNLTSVIANPLLTFLIIFLSYFAKVAGSILGSKKELGYKNSILLGIALSVRFSTGIVVAQFLYLNNVIDSLLFSSIISSITILTITSPLLLSYFLRKWYRHIV